MRPSQRDTINRRLALGPWARKQEIERALEQEYDFDGGYGEMRREAERLRPLIREALIDELLENPAMGTDEIRRASRIGLRTASDLKNRAVVFYTPD